MAEKLGNKNRVYITDALPEEAADVTAAEWITGETTNSIHLNGNTIEVSDKNSGAWQKFLPGVKGATIDVTANVHDEDAVQKQLLSSFMAGDKVFVFAGDIDAGIGYACEAVITTITENNDNAAVSTRSMTLTANGEVKRIEAAEA